MSDTTTKFHNRDTRVEKRIKQGQQQVSRGEEKHSFMNARRKNERRRTRPTFETPETTLQDSQPTRVPHTRLHSPGLRTTHSPSSMDFVVHDLKPEGTPFASTRFL